MATIGTAAPPEAPELPARPSTARLVVGWAAVAGTLPYLTVKLAWIGGSTVGMARPSSISGPAMLVGNVVTALADLVLIAVVLALTCAWGYRVPAWAVLLSGWVGTGFLVPIAVSIVPATAVFLAAGTVLGDRSMEPWVGPLVYGGFAWQGVFLAAAFVGHARARWGHLVRNGFPRRARTAAGQALVAAAVVAAVVAAGLHAVAGAALPHLPLAAFAVLGAAGLVTLRCSTSGGARWAGVVAMWCGSSAIACSGLYAALLAVAVPGYPVPGGTAVPAQLVGLAAGALIAAAALPAVRGVTAGARTG